MKAYGFGKLKSGETAGLYVLRNTGGMQAAVTDYGAALVKLIVPGRDGIARDVVLGYDDVTGYEKGNGFIGGTVGRFANRIEGADFVIDGVRYELSDNDGSNALHGGRDYYVKRLWGTKIPFGEINTISIYRAFAVESLNDRWPEVLQENISGDKVTFVLNSPDGDQGFPGNLKVEVTYTLTDDNELHIDYMAVSDKDTPLNLTNHSYFNLNGHDSGTILGHFVHIRADRITASDSQLLPTGEIRSVAGTPMDFLSPKMIGAEITADYDQLLYGRGYDHNYIVSDDAGEYKEVASMYSEESGIHMAVLTDMPGLQFYTANGMNDEPGKMNSVYGPRHAACFESQFWPDAVNKENFPGGILRAGEEFRSRTTYRFSN